ncbi:hypothetical protein D920_00838 [Enterococcus faecalis 13-SD-W-01]|nr:hypothetical protein D920_00838 [Enterococcus faecalis 13-SD-W-01]
MKKLKLAATGMLLAGMFAVNSTVTVLAADSTAEVGLTENQGGGSGPTDPTDPTDPGQPNPEPVDPTPETGPLILKVVPRFNFGTHEIEQTGGTYDDTEQNTNYIEVRDNREAGTNGWSVTVSRTEFADGQNTLTGASIELPAGVVRNSIASSPQGNSTTADPVDATAIRSTSGEIPVTGSSLTILETLVNNDTVGKGITTSNIIENSPAKLKIAPGTAKTGTFTSTITWTVTAAP